MGTEITRNLMSIRTITNISPIQDADRIVLATIDDGWTCITQKTNEFKIGDLVVYFEPDSFIPVGDSRFEFLRERSFKSTTNLGDGFRIRVMKMKGQVSYGLILPLTEFPEIVNPIAGQDLTSQFAILKFEKPIPANMAGKIKGNFPPFIPKTDQERIQNFFSYFHKYSNHIWEISLKLDGSSCTVYYKDGAIGVCSRNLDLIEDDENLFWKTAKSSRIVDVLNKLNRNIAIQGELIGPGVQGNREQLKEHNIFIFDIWDIDNQRYLTSKERMEFIEEHNLVSVPFISYSVLSDYTVENFLTLSKQKSLNHKIAEGIVFKSLDNTSISFKAINPEFLLKED